MNDRIDPEPLADSSFDADDAVPIDEWTLDELDDSADLTSLRSAWTHADDRYE